MKYVSCVTWNALEEVHGFWQIERLFNTIDKAKQFILDARNGTNDVRKNDSNVRCASIHGLLEDNELDDPLGSKFVYLHDYACL